jgi:WhiB family redox-sensing transcriptional regulator
MNSIAWMEGAPCKGLSGMFHPTLQWRGETQRLFHATEKDAKAVCAACPVKEQCLEYALTNREYGVWGGTTEAERRRIRTARRNATKAEAS